MTRQNLFKRLVRARMEKTGESYTAARATLPDGEQADRMKTFWRRRLAALAAQLEAGNAAAPGKVMSRDGTRIAFERSGDGPALVLVDGALCSRSYGPMGPLAELLAIDFSVYRYDRRGRGGSGDTCLSMNIIVGAHGW